MIKIYDDFYNRLFFPDPFRVITNIDSSFDLKIPGFPSFYSDDFRNIVKEKQSNSFKEIISFIKEHLTGPLQYYLRQEYLSDFFQCIIDDFVIELFDLCLFRILKDVGVEAQTAKSKFSYGHSYQTLRKNLLYNFKNVHINEDWNFFIAKNVVPIGTDSCDLSFHGAPAIITTLDMNKSLVPFKNESLLDYSVFQQQHELLITLIEEKQLSWKAALNKYNYDPEALAFYHMEKLWKLNYIYKLISYFDKIDIGITFYPSNPIFFKHSSQSFYKLKLQDDNISPFWNILNEIEKNSSNLQTNLFLMNYLLSSKIDPNIYDMNIPYYLISSIVPSIKDILYYCILKGCITETISGIELNNRIHDFCSPFSREALKNFYKLNDTKDSVKQTDHDPYFFSKIASYVYNKQRYQTQYFSPKVFQEKIIALCQSCDKLNYDSSIFQNIDHINEINKL